LNIQNFQHIHSVLGTVLSLNINREILTRINFFNSKGYS
jgi:hypothetical protein